jgi:hypothetical protein
MKILLVIAFLASQLAKAQSFVCRAVDGQQRGTLDVFESSREAEEYDECVQWTPNCYVYDDCACLRREKRTTYNYVKRAMLQVVTFNQSINQEVKLKADDWSDEFNPERRSEFTGMIDLDSTRDSYFLVITELRNNEDRLQYSIQSRHKPHRGSWEDDRMTCELDRSPVKAPTR